MLLPFALILLANVVINAQQLEFWLTDPDGKVYFQQRSTISPNTDTHATNDVIVINDTARYQSMAGFGYTLTGGSAFHLHNLDNGTRAQLLQELFNTDKNNIGVSFLRISIGASDLDAEVFTYNDLPDGQTDRDLNHFDLGKSRTHLIPILKEILAINPNIQILGSPWTAPTWMKTNKGTVGGKLLPGIL